MHCMRRNTPILYRNTPILYRNVALRGIANYPQLSLFRARGNLAQSRCPQVFLFVRSIA